EVFNRAADYFPQYLRALDRGWRLGAIGVSDQHEADWGSAAHPACGLLARELTWDSAAEALRARRVYATRERGLALAFTADGRWPGDRLECPAGQSITLEVAVEAAPGGSMLQRLEVWVSGGLLLAACDLGGTRSAVWSLQVPPPGQLTWYL